MKNLLLKLLFFLYRKDYYKPLSKIEVDNLLAKIANDESLKRFPDYLTQCSVTARNQFLYTQDEILKGTIFAFESLRDQIIKKKQVKKKDLTQEEKNVIMRKRGY